MAKSSKSAHSSKSRSKSRSRSKSKRTTTAPKTAKKGKKKLNEYFTAMLAAKKSGAKSFKYNGHTYVAVKKGHLTVYKKK